MEWPAYRSTLLYDRRSLTWFEADVRTEAAVWFNHDVSVEKPGFNTIRKKLATMSPSPASGNWSDFDLKRAVTEALDARGGVLDYEITESAPEHVLVTVTETTEDGKSRVVLYRVQHEPRPDGTDDIHWECLGSAADEESE